MNIMPRSLSEAGSALRTTQHLRRGGLTPRQIARAVATGELVRLRPGWYAQGERWRLAAPEARQLMAVQAAHAAQAESAKRAGQGSPRVFSHRSAATLHALPVWSGWMRHGREPVADTTGTVHLLLHPAASGTFGDRVVRHRGECSSAEIVEIAGFACTSADRTLADLSATEPFAVALACADQQVRVEAARDRTVDVELWGSWRKRMLDYAEARKGKRGVAALRALARLADPRAESPLESVSRLRALQLGLDAQLQVRVPAEDGGTLHLDFVFAAAGVFGECDGRSKYSDPDFLRGRTPEQVVEAERRRHNWVSGSTGMAGVRWEARHVVTVARFAERMRRFQVPFPGRASRAYGPEVEAFLNALAG